VTPKPISQTDRHTLNYVLKPAEADTRVTVEYCISVGCMRSLVLKFRVHDRALGRALDVHKIRNFAEDLSLHLRDLGDLPMEEADRAIDTVVVHDIHARQLRRCRTLVEKFLDKHFLAADCDIVELHGGIQ
jgi:hypothetical protein